ncbi:MAG: two-component system, NarL family, uhpT operon response regulator UhpA [Mycobacteriales bacterium]|jgi:DNA-binding NarL/FixJ family response regulator
MRVAVVVSSVAESVAVRQLLDRAGAGTEVGVWVTTSAELPSAARDADLVLRAVAPGRLPPPVPATRPHPAGPALSTREREVLAAIAGGLTHAQIARRLRIATATVDTYVARIRTKLGVGNKAELTRAAMYHLDPGQLVPALAI